MKCSKCGGDFIKQCFAGIEFEICKECNALKISKDNFGLICKKIDENCTVVDLFSVPAVKVNEQIRTCPDCSCAMEKVISKGVLIDRCKNCEILLFDNGELSKYFSAFSNKKEIMGNIKFIKTYCGEVETKENNEQKEPKKDTYKSPTVRIQCKEYERELKALNGWTMVIMMVMAILISLPCCIFPFLVVIPAMVFVLAIFCLGGFKIVQPQEALVFTLFGEYVGTIREPGFYWVNPFCSTVFKNGLGSISLKARTLDNGIQKINDKGGNPIQIGIMVTWEVRETAMAVFNVDNYEKFLSAQCDSALRNIARLYPYDSPEDSDIPSLRGDSAEISAQLKREIQAVVTSAGIHIIDARITHLAYSTEIAAAMLQRQQAIAVIEAKKALVDGAVGMVEMAIDRLSSNPNVVLDDKTKANMVNNLLVVLCGNKESTPVIRSDKL